MSDNQVIQMCECCGLRSGQLNSQYLFNSPLSDRENDPSCGDWVCQQCEQEAEDDNRRLREDYEDETPLD